MTKDRQQQVLGGGGTLKARYNWVSGVMDKVLCPPLEGGPKSMISRWGKKLDCFALARNDGFTLAEVLITLGIIGVVAAMTIPNLISNWQVRRTVSRLVQTQSILSQAIRMAEEEYGEVSSWGITGSDTASAELIANNLKPFLKVAIDCGTANQKDRCIPDYYHRLDGRAHEDTTEHNYIYNIVLQNGSFLRIRGTNTGDKVGSIAVIYVDTNGTSPPNTYGKDYFQFKITDKGALYPIGHPEVSNSAEICVKGGTGYGCTYYVLTHKNMDYLKK